MQTASLFESVDSVLCIGAHPDDIEIGCGGTLITLLGRRPEVSIRWLVLTGSQESHQEARRSARTYLGDDSGLVLHSFRDSYLPYDDPGGVKAAVVAERDRAVPDLVFVPRMDDAHQDHRFVAELARQVFRSQVIFGYEIVKYEGDLGAANLYVPISPSTADTKVERLLDLYLSQSDRAWFDRGALLGLMRVRGVEARVADGYAEAFQCPKLVLG